MKKNDVKIGQAYMAKVTGTEAPVRIDAENPHGGWDAKNLVSGRKVHIKTAQRLHRECTQADLANIQRSAPQRRRTKKNKAVSQNANRPSPNKTNTTNQAKPNKKKLSGLDAAARVLAESSEPMTCRQIVEVASQKDYWHSNAATPWATIYSAIIREIATQGDQSRFERGKQRGAFQAAHADTQA